MTAQELNVVSCLNTVSEEEEYSIPLDISDIIIICQEYNKLGWNIQNQVENILELGVEQSIKQGYVKQESLPFIKNFLIKICDNPYFGDAGAQSKECVLLIEHFQSKNKLSCSLN